MTSRSLPEPRWAGGFALLLLAGAGAWFTASAIAVTVLSAAVR